MTSKTFSRSRIEELYAETRGARKLPKPKPIPLRTVKIRPYTGALPRAVIRAAVAAVVSARKK